MSTLPPQAPKWLRDYYGKDFGILGPTVELEGKNVAVVRLTWGTSNKAYSSVGYVLVKKSGKHSVSKELSLHEGLASRGDMDTMKRVLEQEDSK